MHSVSNYQNWPISNYGQQKPYHLIVRQFLQTYKVTPCFIYEYHDQNVCYGFHSPQDRRRNPYHIHSLRYETQYCSSLICTQDQEFYQNCMGVHNCFEQHYHPKKYKTHECPKYDCLLGLVCTSAHPQDFQQFEISQYFRFDLNTFKTSVCPIATSTPHCRQTCLYYHFQNDKRRINFNEYSHVRCAIKKCNDPNCKYSHNKIEQLYHPTRYKTKFCLSYFTDHTCKYREFCSFAHHQTQIVIDLIDHLEQDSQEYQTKFKTIWCPYTQNHERSNCIYAHNFQDFRRNLKEFYYKPERCKDWNFDSEIKCMEQAGCKKGLNCQKCHGWMEQKCHPLFNHKTGKAKSQKSHSSRENDQREGVIVPLKATIGAPFFKNDKLQKVNENDKNEVLQRQASYSSKKTKAKSKYISSDQSNDDKKQIPLKPNTMPQFKASFLMFEDEDKVWNESSKQGRYKSEQKKSKKQTGSDKAACQTKEMYYNQVAEMQLPNCSNYAQQKMIGERLNNNIIRGNFVCKGYVSKKLHAQKFRRQFERFQYSKEIMDFFEKRNCLVILQKMKQLRVSQVQLIHLPAKDIRNYSFLNLDQKRQLAEALEAYSRTDEQQYAQIQNLVNQCQDQF